LAVVLINCYSVMVISYSILKSNGLADLIKYVKVGNGDERRASILDIRRRFYRNAEHYKHLALKHCPSLVDKKVTDNGEVSYGFTRFFVMIAKFA